ncbi:MAG TPA: phage major capsid protein [Burkholderiales bacterium]|nr:phage major capsid protein [Burkholderiales bacterium]
MQSLADITARDRALEARSDFLRYAWTLLRCADGAMEPARLAEREFGQSSPNILRVLKAAVSAGTTTSSGESLAPYRQLTGEWVSLLQSRTLLGRIPFVKVDFDTRTFSGDPPTGAWVAEGFSIPVSRMNFNVAQLPRNKIAGIAVFTDEQVATFTPATAAAINRGLLDSCGRFSDIALLDPEISAVTGKNPASLTNGISATPTTGSTESAVTNDIKNLLATHIAAGADLSELVFALHPTTATYLSTLLTSAGIRAFPNLGARGGDIFGIPCLTSFGARTLGSPSDRILALINPRGVTVADNGELEISASKETAVQMDDAPTNKSTATATGTSLVSMFQANSTALKFVRRLNFSRVIDGAISYLRVSY